MTAFNEKLNTLRVRIAKSLKTEQGVQIRLLSQRLIFGSLSNLNFLSIVTAITYTISFHFFKV